MPVLHEKDGSTFAVEPSFEIIRVLHIENEKLPTKATHNMRATLTYNGKTIQAQLNKSTITDDLYIIFTQEETPQYKRLKLDIHPKTDVVLDSLEIELPMTLAATDRVFCNGFQSWSSERI